PQVGELLVAGPQPRLGVDDEHGDAGVGQRGARLIADRAGERIRVGEVDAAGVDEVEASAVPLGLDLVAVARDARALVHDRRAPARQPVDERALAHVGIADDRDLHSSSRILATTSSTLSPVVSIFTAPGAG